MNATTLSVAAGIARGADPEALAAIARPGNAAALWERRLPPGFAAWLDAVPPASLPVLRAAGAPLALLPDLLHRSPPFGRDDTTRLLLVLDPGDACDCC
jgi:hypothetical protein